MADRAPTELKNGINDKGGVMPILDEYAQKAKMKMYEEEKYRICIAGKVCPACGWDLITDDSAEISLSCPNPRCQKTYYV